MMFLFKKYETYAKKPFRSLFLCSKNLMQSRPCDGTTSTLPFAPAWSAGVVFAEIMTVAQYEVVSEYDCVPPTVVQPLYYLGVDWLEFIFEGDHCSARNGAGGGYIAVTDASLVIELAQPMRPHISSYFKEGEGLAEQQIEVNGATKQNQYGIVSGHRSHAAVWTLTSELEGWLMF